MPDNEVGVTVTTAQMYGLLLSMDHKLNNLQSEVSGGATTIRDHETRIREIEQREDLSRRVSEIEVNLKAIQQRLWAFPSLAGLAAVVALVIAISDKL